MDGGSGLSNDLIILGSITSLNIGVKSGKLASLNRSWQSKKARIVRWGWQELNPNRPSQNVTGPHFRLNHSAKGGREG